MSTLRNIIIFRFPVDKRETLDFISYVHKLFSSVTNAVNGVLEAKVAKKFQGGLATDPPGRSQARPSSLIVSKIIKVYNQSFLQSLDPPASRRTAPEKGQRRVSLRIGLQAVLITLTISCCNFNLVRFMSGKKLSGKKAGEQGQESD